MKSKLVITGLKIASFAIPLIFSAVLFAQPFEGPYGPIDKKYKIPDVQGKIYYASPDASSDGSGASIEQPGQLSALVQKARTGDAIILRGGTYRTGNLKFNQGIIFQAYADEKPVLKGTYEAENWTKEGENLWSTQWTKLFPAQPESWWRRDRNEKYTPLHRFNDDMVFVDGNFLQSAANTAEVNENTFYIDYENKKVYIGADPSDKLVEITAYNVAIHRTYKSYQGISSDSIGPILRGITFTQYADTAILIEGTYPEGPLDEADYGNDVTGTVIENCEISWCSRIGVFVMGDSLTIRNCKVSNTSTEGIYLIGASDALIERTIVSKNNIEHLTGYFPAGVKIFNQSHRVTCRENLVTDQPNSNGIWYDVGNKDGLFINNWIEKVGDSSTKKYSKYAYMSGFFFEISKGAICAGNVFVNCDNGSFVLNSSDVQIYNNTFINCKVAFGRTERSAQGDHFGWHPATGPDVDERDGHVFQNNLMVKFDKAEDPFLEVWQAPNLCGKLSSQQLIKLDNNVYINKLAQPEEALFVWSTIDGDSCTYNFSSPADINKLSPEFEGNSTLSSSYNGKVFNNIDLEDYSLSPEFKVNTAGSVPESIQKLLNVNSNQIVYPGAYYRD